MRVGLVSGSASYSWPGLTDPAPQTRQTAYGPVPMTFGSIAGVDVVHLSRHGAGHARLSSQVDHRANLAALVDCGVDCMISMTVCGAVDPTLRPGSLVVFDDLYFPTNRLPDGSLCTWHQQPGGARRGHWIFDRPFSEPLRETLLQAAGAEQLSTVAGGCYGHVDGPRFNSRSEIALLAAAGVRAVSQTAGPEVVLAGEAELPMALLGYVTDYANGVARTPTPIEELLLRMRESSEVFAQVVAQAVPRIGQLDPVGLVYRFDP